MSDTRIEDFRTGQMDLREYVRVIRRRWPILVVAVLVGLAIGYLTAKPSSSGPSASTGLTSTTYQATTIMSTASSTTNDPSGLSLDAMAFLAQSGPVPTMTAKSLGASAAGLDIAGRVQVTPKDPLNLMQVTASEATRDQAATVANAFADQVIAYINDQLQVTYDANVSTDRKQLDSLSAVMSKLQTQPPSPTTQSELGVAESQYAQLYVTYQELLLQGPQHTGLHVIYPASPATTVASSSGITHVITSTGKGTRTALGGLTGLIIGIALALARERIDTRIHTREQAERIFGLPVLGEIPRPAIANKRRGLVVTEEPTSNAAESIRMLRTVLALSRPPGGRKGGLGNGLSRAILLSSPTRVNGKGELIANLAASFSEAGNSVALVAVDPFDVSIAGLLGGSASAATHASDDHTAPLPHLNGTPVATNTDIRGVSLLMNGQLSGNGTIPGKGQADLVAEGRRSAELVLVDAPPALATHEAGRLSAVVDSVVLLCELGHVTAREAALTVDVMHRVGAPLHGIVLIEKANWTTPLPLVGARGNHRRPRHAMRVPALPPEASNGHATDAHYGDTAEATQTETAPATDEDTAEVETKHVGGDFTIDR